MELRVGNGLADGRGRDANQARGGAHVAGLHDGLEDFELPQVHGSRGVTFVHTLPPIIPHSARRAFPTIRHPITTEMRMLAPKRFKDLVAGFALAAFATLAAAQAAKPNVVVLATGGTIAGAGASAAN